MPRRCSSPIPDFRRVNAPGVIAKGRLANLSRINERSRRCREICLAGLVQRKESGPVSGTILAAAAIKTELVDAYNDDATNTRAYSRSEA